MMVVKTFNIETNCEICYKKIKLKDDWIRVYHKYFCSNKCADIYEKEMVKNYG